MTKLPPWIELALKKKGLMEGKNNAELRKFLKSDGESVGDPSKLPWCGDFVETCLALTGYYNPPIVNPYLARNWLKFGVDVGNCFGAVAVFWRGTKTGSSGHVAFLVGEGQGVWYILGGNQSNSVSIMAVDKGRLLGSRMPGIYTARQPLPIMQGGRLSINEE